MPGLRKASTELVLSGNSIAVAPRDLWRRPNRSITPPVPDYFPLKLLLATFAGWVGRQQAKAIEYLVEENRVLREQLGDQRLRLDDDHRRRLAVRGHVLGRRALAMIATNPSHRAIRLTLTPPAVVKVPPTTNCGGRGPAPSGFHQSAARTIDGPDAQPLCNGRSDDCQRLRNR